MLLETQMRVVDALASIEGWVVPKVVQGPTTAPGGVAIPDAPPNFAGSPGSAKATQLIGVIKAYGYWTALALLILAGGLAGVSHMGGFGGGQSKAMQMAGGAVLGAVIIGIARTVIEFAGS